MYVGQAEESVECPVCGAGLRQRRPPFRLGDNRFDCVNCGTPLRFSGRSQRRLVYVVLVVLATGPVAVAANHLLGGTAGLIIAVSGAAAALGMLVWQGKVPQLEVDK